MNTINPKKTGNYTNVIHLFKQGDTSSDQLKTDRYVPVSKSDPNQNEGNTKLNQKNISKSPPLRKQFWMSDTPVEVWD
ncbi:hypothetical protein OM416_19280 [Paenibacillus sp. LS1]|uniref:hypothetical protein n=1 Tax=Paenibacillus sp. LS1 TaxID=2992120 RepID=UPI00222F5CC4|nr:hypothetical protein [Paenibacillus sp. LS1]MCW3793739.1 hypothetical protein [Paenibacillus sp. LS1]